MVRERSDGKRDKRWEMGERIGRERRDGKRDDGTTSWEKKEEDRNYDRGRRNKWRKTRRSRMEI